MRALCYIGILIRLRIGLHDRRSFRMESTFLQEIYYTYYAVHQTKLIIETSVYSACLKINFALKITAAFVRVGM